MADPEQERVLEAVRSALDFVELDDATIGRLVSSSSLVQLEAGDRLFDKGSPPDALYVVVSGSIRIFDVLHGAEHDLALIEPGDLTGEVSMALKTGRTRSASAKEDSEVLVLPVAAIQELASAQPALGAQLLDAFERRTARREEAAAESE